MEIGIREFRDDLKKWFEVSEGEEVCVRRRGKVYTINCKIGVHKENSVHKKDKDSVHKIEVAKEALGGKLVGEYGCGCKRESGKVLCSKHGRV